MSLLQLPFEPNDEAVDSWLGSLPTNPGECCRMLNDGLQALLGGDLAQDFRFRALEKLKPILFIQSHRLAQSYLGKPQGNDDKMRKLALLGVQFPGELGKGYLALARAEGAKETTDPEFHARMIYEALECFELYSLRLAQIFEPPSNSFWGRIFELFAMAEAREYLGWRPVVDSPAMPGRRSVESLFGQILMFHRAAPNQLNPDQIQRLHELLGAHVGLVAICRAAWRDGHSADLYIDLDAPRDPQPFDPSDRDNTGANRRYLYCRELRSKLALLSQPTTPEAERLAPAFAAHLEIRLGGIPVVSQEAQSRSAVIIPRLEDLIARLAILEVRSQERQPWLVGGIDLELMPLGNGSTPPSLEAFSKSAGTFAPGKTSDLKGQFQWQRGEYPCKVYRAEAPGYYLLEPSGVTLRPGMLVAINTDNRLIQLGLIAGGAGDGSAALMPFELLGSEPVPVKVFLDASPSKSRKAVLAKLATAREGCQGLFAESLRLRGGEQLTLERDGVRRRCKVLRIRESSRDFREYEIAFEDSAGPG
ncbi:MAG: hypothetical protein FIA97_14065 [Methylococcaceae bacterium]|nr:hypothetical protein [Methylococcaceae bacterium]